MLARVLPDHAFGPATECTGMAVLEKTLATPRFGYIENHEITSPFIPWFPRKLAEKE